VNLQQKKEELSFEVFESYVINFMQKYFKKRAESLVYKIICIIAKSFQLRIHKFTYFRAASYHDE
tara:strand:- start:399 stop:593 length:195 start_codon:yes stop_codon:yes gene_type:complete